MSAAPDVCFFDAPFLDALSAEARISPRLRKNFNLHASTSEPVQRFFNAIEPGSYIAPHRHSRLPAQENLFLMRGSLGVLIFDDSGTITEARTLVAGGACCGLTLAANVWHSVVSLEAGTIVLEVKQGPFVPLAPEERAIWAPADGSAATSSYLADMQSRFSTATQTSGNVGAV